MAARPTWRRAVWIVLALLAGASPWASAQAVSVSSTGGALTVRAPGFGFLEGQALARLKDGQSVRVELTLAVLPGRGKPPAATRRRVFALSYDLWEERFAATLVEAPSETASHLTKGDAESWCLEQLSIPLGALAAFRSDVPFWIRLEYRILNGDAAGANDDSLFTLQGLIDVLSRRRGPESRRDALEAGPFTLPRRDGAPPSPG